MGHEKYSRRRKGELSHMKHSAYKVIYYYKLYNRILGVSYITISRTSSVELIVGDVLYY